MRTAFDTFVTAWLGIITHKLRSFLTILGIVIGVGAVITLMSIGRGAEADILSRITSLGTNLVTISPGAPTSAGVRAAFGSGRTLTVEDATAIGNEVAGISAIAPMSNASMQLVAGSYNTNAPIVGTTPSYLQIGNLTLAEGSFFSDQDYNISNKVIVLGADVAADLFPNGGAVGQQIRMGSIIVHVIGVLDSKGAGMGSSDQSVYIPLSVLQQTVSQQLTAQGGHIVSSIALTVVDTDQSAAVTADITSLLRGRHRLSATAGNDFRIQSVEELAATLTETTGTMTLLLGAIAAISLLVGGIGVMNIMLVSVLERTREIGIRKALGAHEWHIWSQFLVEASFLSLTGGIFGVLAGEGASRLVPRFFTSLHTLVSPDIILLAVGVSVGIGLFFGFYPAWNAARLNPIQALRSE